MSFQATSNIGVNFFKQIDQYFIFSCNNRLRIFVLILMGYIQKSASSFLIPFVGILLSMIAISAQAQDDGITSYDLQNSIPEVVEHENRTSKNLISSRDSLQISDFYQKPRSVERKTANAESNDQEDALSLNFLFYIIENYKFSDLMDEN
jgi:hypothetical protein